MNPLAGGVPLFGARCRHICGNICFGGAKAPRADHLPWFALDVDKLGDCGPERVEGSSESLGRV
jgi:hypothetical protein